MARTNLAAARIKPQITELLMLEVLRSAAVSPHFVRVTLGGRDIQRFAYLGYDQWFRLFIPVQPDDAEAALTRMPNKLDTVSYLKYLTLSKSSRPVIRNYTVRGYRDDGPNGPELDVDFVVHGLPADGSCGPAAGWAQRCVPGDVVAILDEGVGFNPEPGLSRVQLVADETGLPAVAGILGSLPAATQGRALIEIPGDEDRQELSGPDGVTVQWVVRQDEHATPGAAVLSVALAEPVGSEPFYGWVVGESALPTTLRRHWVRAGVPKRNIMFCGYWKAP